MTPKDKAEELVEKMYLVPNSYGECLMETEEAKKCALIAVDEIIDVLGGSGVYSFADIKVSEYWEEVKKEIEKL